MIIEDYCSFEVAKLFKEKGLDTKFVFFYRTDEEGKYIHHANTLQPISYKIADDEVVAAITHQMAMKFLREVHNIHIAIDRGIEHYFVVLTKLKPYQDLTMKNDVFDTYEEAVEAALKYCLINLI